MTKWGDWYRGREFGHNQGPAIVQEVRKETLIELAKAFGSLQNDFGMWAAEKCLLFMSTGKIKELVCRKPAGSAQPTSSDSKEATTGSASSATEGTSTTSQSE